MGVIFLDNDTKGRLEGCEIWGNKLDGVHIDSGADPILFRCNIHDGDDGGVYILGAGTKGRLERCDISRNKSAGVRMFDGSPVLYANTIRANAGQGIAISNGADPLISRNFIYGNAWVNVAIRDCPAGRVSANCIFGSKKAGIYLTYSSSSIIDNAIYGNAEVRFVRVGGGGAAGVAVSYANISLTVIWVASFRVPRCPLVDAS